jgi:hypothetical protein
MLRKEIHKKNVKRNKKYKQENQPSNQPRKYNQGLASLWFEACRESFGTFFMRDKKKFTPQTTTLIAKRYFDYFIRSMKKHLSMHLNFIFFFPEMD